MEIAHAFFARWAEALGDNTISTIGAGFDVVRAPNYPAAFPITVVIKLVGFLNDTPSTPPERPLAIQLTMDAIGPDGSRALPHMDIALTGKHVRTGLSGT